MKTKLFLSILMLLSTLSFAHSQDAEQTPARQAFDAVFGEWKDVLAQMRTLQAEAQNKEDSELPPLVAEYDKLIVKGESLIPKLAESAIAVYKEAPNEDRQISRWLSTIASDYVVADRFADAKPVLDALIEGKASDPTVLNNAGIVAFAANDYEAAKQHLEAAAAAGVLTSQSQNMLNVVDDYVEYWAAEKKLRDRADALSDEARLPRVKMETNRGTLVVELFEDEAPETVGNFVNLVDAGFYDGLTFHRVIGGFMAQGGDPDGNGTGGPGYEIYCECVNEDHRKHFLGSLSMAHAGRDTGGSQFFITFVPTPMLNGDHTVFGRVVEGFEVLPKLKRRDPEKSSDLSIVPDKIVKAEVLNRRNHEYKPNKVR